MSRGIVLHHRHLRQTDHAALHRAAQEHDEVVPVFVFDPKFYKHGLSCDARLRFLHECLEDIDVSLFHGNPADVVQRLNGDVYTIHTATGRYGLKRNRKLHEAGVTFVQGDGLRRVSESRDGWSDAIAEWFTDDLYDAVEVSPLPSEVSIEWIEDEYDVSPEKENVLRGGRTAALNQLEEFVDSEYSGHISEPTREAGVSDLSPYIRFGCLSLREVYQHATEKLSGRDKSMFESRLYWNLHYQQKLLDWPGWMNKAVNPALRGVGSFDKEQHERFINGKTGYPMIDAAVRCLTQTGWLNFRCRAMLATFYGKLLNLPWKRGADWMYYHLIDADPGINYTQWQSQTGRVGTNLYRVYNPRKQVKDHDTSPTFIKRFVPELQDFPEKFLARPERAPYEVQKDAETIIGEDYPYPIVEYESARRAAERRFEALQQEAERALNRDEVQERASFSNRGHSSSVKSEKQLKQKTLGSF